MYNSSSLKRFIEGFDAYQELMQAPVDGINMAAISDGALDEIPLEVKDSPEFRILMAYASRSLPASKLRRLQSRPDGSEEDSDAKQIPGTEDLVARNKEDRKGHETSKVSKKKSKKKWLRRMARGMRARYAGEGDTNFENVVAGKLRRIVKSQLRKTKSEKKTVWIRNCQCPSRIFEHSGARDENDELIKQLVKLLREEGDKADEKNVWLTSTLQKPSRIPSESRR
ncbi:uncharacterized protein LOC128490302 [Spea bombifrons]|uniref:uncharacterized protein LOC128490302 n=1 Tax=Spea bombifrons TaxID=233779 RepID=UPI00234A1543|nr:uncharacterized protein LOC128490302 [Spea bombifrons]